MVLVKLARDLTRPGPPKGSVLEGKSPYFRETGALLAEVQGERRMISRCVPLISGKSGLVKYYSIWPDG